MKTSQFRSTPHIISLISLLISIIGGAVFVTPAHAATFTVTNLNDSGAGSLRQAITDANAAADADTITFSVSGTITLVGSQLPNITAAGGALTVDGTGQTVTISGNNVVGVLSVDAGASLTVNTLTIANGTSSGGIYNYGTLTVTNSTFSGNSATGFFGGGGISNIVGTLTITNSTFSGNSATGLYGGGGIFNNGTATITNSTFSGNSATSTGGGIYTNAGTVTLRNTIVANSPSGGNCSGTVTNGGNNIDDGMTCSWGSASGSMSNTPPLLGALANSGGPTQTYALLTGSPAINAGNDALCPAKDQRGVARSGAHCDIGAYESALQPGISFVVNTLADTDDTACEVAPGTCTLREAINAANSQAGANTITFSFSNTITLGTTLPNITAAGGALTMDGTGRTVVISGNNAVRVLIVDTGASLTLNNLTIANGNPSFGYGGGIYNYGTLTVTNSTFSGNAATGGGGIYNHYTGTLTVTNSTFSGNSATWGGGGIYSYSGTATITNSTFSGNSSGGNGGGIYNDGGTMTLRNTIVANHPSGGNCYGTITNGGNNLDDGTTCLWDSTSGSMSNTDPLLGALANNGGPTQTFALLTGSPAINAGNDTLCAAAVGAPNFGAGGFDQRGVARPQGAHCDIGSYETKVQSGPNFVVNVLTDPGDSVCEYAPAGDCTLREAINAANAQAGANTITFSLSGTITLGSQLPNITAAGGALTIDGTGRAVVISGNNTVRVLWVDASASLTLNNLTIANGNANSSSGGGIFNNGTANITNSTFSGNSATYGGGIVNSSSGTLTITNSTFSGNSGGIGGGIDNSSGTLAIMNSTFSGNSATSYGGGIYNLATLTITNSTFSGNSATTSYHGGGLRIEGGTATLRNTIVANSTSGGNCTGPIAIINGGNNIDSGTTCGWGSASGSKSNTDPLLGALTGSPAYFPLTGGSPAIDAGNDAICAAAPVSNTSQNGLTRPQGAHCDIGAFELRLFNIFLPIILR